MFRKCFRKCRKTATTYFLLQVLCIILGIIALSILFTFLASHIGTLICIAAIVVIITAIQWFISMLC